MLFYHLNWLCNGTLLLMGLAAVVALYAYYVNSTRPADDPEKKNYHPFILVLVPITFPLIILLYISFFLLRVLMYGVFLILFIFALIIVPRPPVYMGVYKTGISIGERLLKVNTLLVRFLLSPWAAE
jgi:hypothetical protein